jgi:EAL domain-containing protein (putative c-di-GMP-specific phosphodiesterase class I)/GGDEF domain-containing protein
MMGQSTVGRAVDLGLLEERFKLAAPAARRGGRGVALLAISVEPRGAMAGYGVGNGLEAAVIERLCGSLRRSDTVVALAPLRYLVLLERLEEGPFAVHAAECVVDAIKKPLPWAAGKLTLRTSVGISVYPDDGERVEELIHCAEMAEQGAQASGGDVFGFYSSPMNERAGRRIAVERSLGQAIEREELEIHFQPQIDTRDGTLVGAEALLRWHDRALGHVSPVEFVPILEATAQIDRVGEWVLNRACAEAASWLRAKGATRVSVNVSPHQLRKADFADTVRRALQTTGLEPHWLGLELTEGVLVEDPASARRLLESLRKDGVHIAVDDFGTGYASLACVRQFPMDTLKIDRQFVRGLPVDAENAAITSAIVALGQSLRLEIVAEGVETEAEEEFLHSLGCYVVQGYRHAHPMNATEFAAWRRARPWA